MVVVIEGAGHINITLCVIIILVLSTDNEKLLCTTLFRQMSKVKSIGVTMVTLD